MFDNKEFKDRVINILDALVTRQPNTTQRYLLDVKAKEWGRLVYTNVILGHYSILPATLLILTLARVETRSTQADAYMRSVKRIAHDKDTTEWFVNTIFFPVLENSSSRQNYTDGRQFVHSEEDTFPKNLLHELSEFRSFSEIAEAIIVTQSKYYRCYQDRAKAIRRELGIKN
ncbi:MAG: hypothetical protein G01um101470_580 [Parcubacteria group bacterium Gr01-1014_70]|nr:MAG: hypothetical protein G01um101470_580 [Parcubacteria group bacterium Gr01-1014_70]